MIPSFLPPGAAACSRQWSRIGYRKHSVLPEPVPVAMTVERPAPAASREKAVRWWRYGVNPSGTSGNGSPPSGARRKGSATERYGPLTRFAGSARKSSTTLASSGLDGPKPVVRKSRRASVTSDATTEGIMAAGARASVSGVQSLCTFPHPCGNVSFRAQHPPHVDVIIVLDVEDQPRKALQRPGSQSRNAQLMSMVR